MYRCPVCKEKLGIVSIPPHATYKCTNNHSFDISKEGYVNLLMSATMHSKNPGDNKFMCNARRDFLNKGYYKPLLLELKNVVTQFSKDNILDVGCGEGYYTDGIYEENRKIYGVDISKNAIHIGKIRNKNIEFSVASVFSLPFFEDSFDTLINLFAPFCESEIKRVLKKDGIFIMAVPDRYHLWELKKVLYEKPYENEVKDFSIDGFENVKIIDVDFYMNLNSNEDILNLFSMTPYYYRTPTQGKEKLTALSRLKVRGQFKLLVYKLK